MDQETFWALVQQHLPYLKQRARVITYYVLNGSRPGSVYGPDDLLHEVLLKIGKNPAQLRYNLAEGQEGFQQLCNTALRTVAYDLISRADSKRVRTLEQEFGNRGALGEDGEGGSPRYQRATQDAQLTPVQLLEKQDSEHHLQEAIYSLEARYPETALVLAYGLEVDGDPALGPEFHQDQAAALGISEASYKQFRHHGIKRLRRCISSELNPQD